MTAADDSRPCEWCHEPIGSGVRRDRRTCSERCKRARNRALNAAVQRSRDKRRRVPPMAAADGRRAP